MCKLSVPYKEIMHKTPRHSYKEIKYTKALKALALPYITLDKLEEKLIRKPFTVKCAFMYDIYGIVK